MEMILTPGYGDLFPGEEVAIADLLKDISSLVVIQLLAMFNAEFYWNSMEDLTQPKMMNGLLGRQSAEIRGNIIDSLNKKSRRNAEVRTHLFSTTYNMHFLHYELINYRDLPFADLTAEQELKVFKAYFKIVEQVNKTIRGSIHPTPAYDEDYFAKTTWPFLIDQFETNITIYPFPILLRGAVFLNYLKYHSPYASYVDPIS
jgi:hypothetical protein